jgi:hypothetical protein
MTPCTNAACLYWVTCQNKDKPCPGNAPSARYTNGYAAMARQEQRLRDSAIEFGGSWG